MMLPRSVTIRQEARYGINSEVIKKVRNEASWNLVVSIALIAVDGIAVNLVNSNQATGSSYTLTYSGLWGGAVCAAASGIAISVVSSRSPTRSLIAISALISTAAALQIIAVMVLQGLAASSCIADSCSTDIANLHIAGTVLSTVLFLCSLDVCGTGCTIFEKSVDGSDRSNIEPAVSAVGGTSLPGAPPPYSGDGIISQHPPMYIPPTN